MELKMTYDEEIKMSKDFYDTIDFTQFISDDKTIDGADLINCIEEYYEVSHSNLIPKEFKGFFLCYMSDEEFIDYLCDRYGWKKRTEYIEKHYIIKER